MAKESEFDNSCGVSGVILGIMAIVTSLIAFFPAIVLGITSVVFSVKQKKAHSNKWSKAGLILGIISIVLSTGFAILAYILAKGATA